MKKILLITLLLAPQVQAMEQGNASNKPYQTLSPALSGVQMVEGIRSQGLDDAQTGLGPTNARSLARPVIYIDRRRGNIKPTDIMHESEMHISATPNANADHAKHLTIDELITRGLVDGIWRSQEPVHRIGSEERYELKEGAGNDVLNRYLVIINGPEGRMGINEYTESKNDGKKKWRWNTAIIHAGVEVAYEEETSDNPGRIRVEDAETGFVYWRNWGYK
jgi:hypothetical protein